MAIVEMKHVNMLAMDADKQALLYEIQKLGCFQMLPSDSEDVTFNKASGDAELPTLEETLTRLSWAIGKLNRYDTTKRPMMADNPTIDESQAQTVLEKQSALMDTVAKLEDLERNAGDLRGQTARNDAMREQLLPWSGFSLAPDEIVSTRNTVAMLGTVPKMALEAWLTEQPLDKLCDLEQVSTQRDQAYIYVLYHRSCQNSIQGKLKELGFNAVVLPPSNLTADEQLAVLTNEQKEVEAKQQVIVQAEAALVSDLPTIKQLYDILNSKRARLLAAKNFSVSQRTFFLQGWAPATMEKTIEKRLKKVAPTVALEFYEPLKDEEPPVLLQNAAIIQPFESVVSGYSLPAPGGIDPTAIMMPFFVNFMGMMISDAGYGVMMAIMMPLLIKFLKPAPGTRRLLWLLMAGGIATVFWGAMYNSWFGFAPMPTVFDPMNNAMPVMGACIALGAVHLFAGLGVAAYMNIKRGKVLDAVADQLSWFLLVVGLVLMILMPSIGKWMALAGAGIILVTSGREKSKNPFKRLISGLGALYGVTSWISDLLSYMRLFGMGLATGVIGMVINILVGMLFTSGPIGWVFGAGLFVGGHLFNLAINTLGAYVHSCRLQYIEFFGKFYEDGGKPFNPLKATNRYVYITETQPRT